MGWKRKNPLFDDSTLNSDMKNDAFDHLMLWKDLTSKYNKINMGTCWIEPTKQRIKN